MKELFKKITNNKQKNQKSSAFSKFFREASSREKKRVFLSVAREASKEQENVIKSVRLAQ